MPIPPLTNLLQEGNRAGITCQVVEGDLPINFKWEKQTPSGRNVELGAVSRRIDEYTSSLIIEKITPSHSGNYTCIAQNNAGEERLTVPVTVNGEFKNSISFEFSLLLSSNLFLRMLSLRYENLNTN